MPSSILPSTGLDDDSSNPPVAVLEAPRSATYEENRPTDVLNGSSNATLTLTWQDLLCLAATVGLATGLLESLYWYVRPMFQGPADRWGALIIWLSPLVQTCTFLLGALLLLSLAHARRTRVTFPIAVACFAFTSALSLLLLWEGLHAIARFLLAAGVAAQTYRLADRRRWPIPRQTIVALTSLVAIWATVFALVEIPARVRSNLASNGLPAASKNSPNILLIVIDTLRSDALHLQEDLCEDIPCASTPNLTRIAREGFEFRLAVAPAPWTLPSHATMFTGRSPEELQVGWTRPLDGRFPTLAEALRERGYLTAGFVGNTIFASRTSGLQRGFGHYEDHEFCWKRVFHATSLSRAATKLFPLYRFPDYTKTVGRKSAESIFEDYLAWLDSHAEGAGQDRPHFAFVNLFDAHDPFVPPQPRFMSDEYQSTKERMLLYRWWGLEKHYVSPETVSYVHQAYLDCVSYIDDCLGNLIAELQERGAWENTLLIVTSDHGEHFGEHGLHGHGNSLYQPLVHVPLLIRCPGQIPAAGSSDVQVGLGDIPATILELVDDTTASSSVASASTERSAASRHTTLPGQSLSSFWSGTPKHTSGPISSSVSGPWGVAPCQGCSPVFRGSMKSVVHDGWKLIANGDGEVELYDLNNDPGELHDLSGTPAARSRLDELRAALEPKADAT